MMATDLAAVLAEERRIMNLYAPDYDAATLTNSYAYQLERSQFVEWITKTVRDAGGSPRELSVLEAGCGTGGVIDLLAQAGFGRLTGVDLAEGMLLEARKRRLPQACWARALIEDPPFRSEAFDVILASFTLHHLYDPQAFFRLVDRSLRPGGWFFVLEYDADSAMMEHSGGGLRRSLGDLVRSLFAVKNRRVLASRPILESLQNPAHREHGFAAIRQAMAHPERYEIRCEPRGVLLAALSPVLVEESAFDRTVARWAGAADHHLARRFGGRFQWVTGRLDRPGSTP